MSRSKRLGLGTPAVLRLIIGEPEGPAARASQLLAEAVRAGDQLVVSNLVVCETYFALRTHYGVPKREALAVLIRMLTEGPVHAVEGSPIVEVLKSALGGSRKLGFIDQLIHAEYRAAGAEVVS